MEEYETAIAEHEKDFRDEREKTIRKLRELAVDTSPPEKEKAEEDSLMIEGMEPLQEEAVPIINVGGLEPVFAVREVDEELKLEEVDESIQEDAVPIEDERPPNLVNLLKDQELYEENPALEMFQPPPQLPSQQPKGQQPGPAQAPAQPPVQPAQPAQLTLSPQGESVLANSLKESVAAQSKVVEKLFDEMKELSRKIDEKKMPQPPAQPMPPIIVNMQQPGGGQPSLRPIVMDLPSAGPQPEGFPRYTAADREDEDEQVFSENREPGEAALEEAPADFGRKAPSPGAPEEQAPGLGAPEEQAPPPRGWPGLEPVTESEPEPELDSLPEEQAEAELEPLAEPARGAGQRPGPPGAREAPRAAYGADIAEKPEPPRSSDDVRRELRDYLDGVRGRLNKAPAKPSNPGDLLDYLGKLSDYLPEREKKRFRGSNERLAMESLKARLAGKKGLRQKVAESFTPAAHHRKEPMTRPLVVETFSYLKDLAAWHPDKAVGAAMRDRIESLVARMGRSQ
jgi:hypothetical protein